MFALPLTATDIRRAEKILGITTKSLHLTPQRQLEIDETLRAALIVGLEQLERRASKNPKVLAFR